ncbi:alpha/beta hydrolase [Psychroserpens algicola]|uniref:Alpha/beta hydrolase-fold protein n=1 Tax=Psychroserpens algicola TaxID=1719034 RepID=A0ABT0HB55_9FLAO|nr:alpha/beta hydrolase-fold protein [Psychroserpens algicola]MCK8481604.1 alpha/beta hydrolase-fold protein [Psychroserpens algicola]
MKKTLLLRIIFLCIVTSFNAQSTASKHVETFKIEAPQLGTHKTIWVYTPKSYHTSKQSYPVMYMFDAQNLFDAETSYVGEWKVDEYLDTLKDNDVIIIGIEHGNEKRIEELTPYPHEKYGGGKGDTFMQFIINTVKPHIDITYRTKPEVEHTSIFGSSLGGLMAFYATLKYPETFSKAGVFSPAFWINESIYELASTTDIPNTSKFYFLAGSKESETMVPDQEKMVALLLKKGVDPNHIQSKVIEGGTHNEAFWSSNFPKAFQWLMTSNSKNN